MENSKCGDHTVSASISTFWCFQKSHNVKSSTECSVLLVMSRNIGPKMPKILKFSTSISLMSLIISTTHTTTKYWFAIPS